VGTAPRATIAELPAGPGVYRFRDARGTALYVGRATDLRRRVASYWSDLRDRGHLRAMVRRIARIEAVACASVHEAAWLERNLLEARMPPWNRTPGGQESPVYLCLDGRPAAPGLSVVYTPRTAHGLRYFGPYLGGQRVRLAAGALHRVHPLAYAGTSLRGAERDMAAIRGATPEALPMLHAAVAAVLERAPDAVTAARERLTRLRDEAAASLAFELAGRIQEELAALDWVTCTQRATSMESVDVDAYGWYDGVLSVFEIRGGRLCGWTQRRCTAARAAPRLAATPAAWAQFAARNAELAARLTAT
jgi:excinuclease ABC subunit C